VPFTNKVRRLINVGLLASVDGLVADSVQQVPDKVSTLISRHEVFLMLCRRKRFAWEKCVILVR
jgi:hypothetical protein